MRPGAGRAVLRSEQALLNDSASAVSTGLRAVVLALPLAVLPGLYAPYDAPKAWWLQAIVVVTASVFLVQRLQPDDPSTAAIRGPSPVSLRWFVAAYAGWLILSTAVSVAPLQSLLGSFARGFGLLTVLAAVALFPLAQAGCRTSHGRRSLIDAALLGSVAVCLLAVCQAFGWDVLPGTTDPATASLRVRSTFGHHVFFGSYLALVIPLTAARFVSANAPERVPYGAIGLGAIWIAGVPVLVWLASAHPLSWLLLPLWGIAAAFVWAVERGPLDDGAPRRRGVSRRAMLGALLTVQVFVVTLSGARGAFLGAIVALVVVVVWSWLRRTAPRARIAILAGLVSLGVALGALAAPLANLRTITATRRMAMTDSESLYTAEVRLGAWSGILGSLGRQVIGREVIPGQNPFLRSAAGYGLDTQEFILDAFGTRRDGGGPRVPRGAMRYVFDRAHNVLLDQLVTGGLVGAGIWIALIAGVVIVGVKRLGASADEEWTLRLGCLGAVLGHTVEGCFGIETAVPSALFWMSAGMLTAPLVTGDAEVQPRPRQGRALWMALLVALAAGGALVMAATTLWLLASLAFTSGIFHASSGQLGVAQLELRRAARLVPWMTAPRSAAADVGLRMASREPDPARRADRLREIEAFLAGAHGGASVSGDIWLVEAKTALTRALDGENDQLRMALAAFAMADRLRSNDADVLTPWSIGLLRDGQPAQARELAERVLSTNRRDWLAWAVAARASAQMGDVEKEKEAAAEARRLVPPGSVSFLERFLQG